DFFLGIPFAQPPLGELRFTNPQSLNQSWANAVPATQYAKECVGYGGDQIGYEVSEDCLYLNVIRPSGYENQDLPVAVWIHGGGFYQGGTPDRRYNLSFIVENSVQIGKPIIGVSIAYRLNAWGFLNSNEVKGSGQTNIGLRDQRLALHWIQENIKAFGGAPEKVAIWGESAGAASVGFQLTAYNGRDDKLFRAGIMESGNPVAYGPLNGTDFYQPLFDGVVSAAGCSAASDKLDCLRRDPFATLNQVLNNTNISTSWNPTVDGDFIQRYTSIQLAEGDFVKVPIISGANSDEGTAFSPRGINTTADFQYWLQTTTTRQYALPQPLVQSLLTAYPDIPDQGIPSSASLGGDIRLGPPFGAQYRRSAAYFGDEVFIANRRLTCQTWANASVPAYCYRFNAIPTGITWPTQVTHFQEVAFVFNNLAGLGYAVNPFENKSSAYTNLSKFMSNSWASFVFDLEPNNWQGRNASIGQWPVYDTAKPQDFVFDANVTSYAEPDTYRQAGIELITRNNIAYHR
ncbi:hypothetical protein LTR04_002349, partial [Oleoguttula sp. CCFEE 6159]